ncbi:MAG: hypothetical protein ABW061_05585 [Polyangiaceae bacterium]
MRHVLPCAVPLLLSVACGGGAQTAKPQPGSAPVTVTVSAPTPASVTVKEPGGDAPDPHSAALDRLESAPWGTRNDKDDQVFVPLPDSENWKRVRYFGVEHYVGFRYGDDHHAMVIAFTQALPAGTPMKSDTCMRHFEAWGLPQTHPFDVKFSPFDTHLGKWQGQILESRTVDGRVNLGFTASEFSGAWAAYPAYPDGCLVMAVAVPWREHKELAQKLRDRWVNEGFALMGVANNVRPERK